MATISDKSKSLKLQLQTGTNASGDPTYSTRTIGSVNVDSTNDDLLAIGNEAGTLISDLVNSVKVSESYTLVS